MQERAKRTGSKSEQTLKITKIEILTIEGFLKITSSRFSKILVDSIKHTSGLRRSIYWVLVQWSHVRAEIPCPLAVQDLSFFPANNCAELASKRKLPATVKIEKPYSSPRNLPPSVLPLVYRFFLPFTSYMPIPKPHPIHGRGIDTLP